MRGWTKIKGASQYAGISERSLRGMLKKGLRHSRLPSGTILIKFSWIDEFLENFEVTDNQLDKIVHELERDFNL